MVTIKPLIKCSECNGESVISRDGKFEICPKCKGAGKVSVLEFLLKFHKRIKQEEIAKKAYFKWLEAGKPEGRDEHFWLEAEEELRNAK